MIIKTGHITNPDSKAFTADVGKIVDIFQKENLEVEIQYQTARNSSGQIVYTAIVIGRAELVEIKSDDTAVYKRGKKEGAWELADRLKHYYSQNPKYHRPNAHTLIGYLFEKIDEIIK